VAIMANGALVVQVDSSLADEVIAVEDAMPFGFRLCDAGLREQSGRHSLPHNLDNVVRIRRAPWRDG
jgi:hypothetical protein